MTDFISNFVRSTLWLTTTQIIKDAESEVTQRSPEVIELYREKSQDFLQFSPDLLHRMSFDETSKKVNHHFRVKGQEGVTRGQNVNFH